MKFSGMLLSCVAGFLFWSSITSSADGTNLAAVVGGMANGYIYTSTDSGVTWTERTSAGSRRWGSITSSTDGTRLAVATWGYIYTSTDSGAAVLAEAYAKARELLDEIQPN